MNQTLSAVTSPRLSPQTNEAIDRTKPVTFTFNGRTITAYEGDTIASALTAANIQVISRSFKYHRPRGLLCCSGHCPNCLVQVFTVGNGQVVDLDRCRVHSPAPSPPPPLSAFTMVFTL
jgi:hypothetical protein